MSDPDDDIEEWIAAHWTPPVIVEMTGIITGTVIRPSFTPDFDDDHITEAERADLWQRYTRAHNVNERCPRPDFDGD